MTITREQIADLRPGDVVEIRDERWPEGSVVRGPLQATSGRLELINALTVRSSDGSPPVQPQRILTVVSRAPRPLYVNHDRTEPVDGDIVRDCDGDAWLFDRGEWWCASPDSRDDDDPEALPIGHYRPLTLLWDGDTGQVVP